MHGEKAMDMAAKVTQSLEPDNLSSITTEYGDKSVTVRFQAEKIGSLIASVDDYLMNARIARDMITAVENEGDDNDNKEDDN